MGKSVNRKTDTEKAMAYQHRQIAAGYVLVRITVNAELRGAVADLARKLRGGNRPHAPARPPRQGAATGKVQVKAWVPADKADAFKAAIKELM